jgi:hypothetical protein
MRAYRTIESWRLQSHSVILSLLQAVWIRYAHEVSGEEAEEVTRRLVERFDRSIRARGARPLVVVLKTDRPLGALVRPGSAEVLDCSHPGYGSDPALRTGGTTGHPSAKLHRHYAGCIGDWIERQLGGPPG